MATRSPADYARTLLDSLDLADQPLALRDRRSPARLWAESGAMCLSGHPEAAPRTCPAPMAACAQGAWLALASLNPDKLDPRFDAHRLLGERAALAGLSRKGRASVGGACRLLDTRDGRLALNLARPDDRELMHAWLEQPADDDKALATAVAANSTDGLVRRGRMMGLAVAPLAKPRPAQTWYRATRCAQAAQAPRHAPLVVDLTSLWAGPLCGQLLYQCGARVVKVEGSRRPDGARKGPLEFFHLLNAGKESLALDLSRDQGRAQLRALLSRADIVLEASRPRALEQMGIVASDFLARRPGQVWLSVTGYGRRSPMRDWIAYGDDAAVAAGLAWLMGADDPVFCGDAIADPLTGLHAALLAYACWLKGGGQLLDISLYEVVSHCIGTSSGAGAGGAAAHAAAAPAARAAMGRAAELGADTERLLREFRC